MTRADLNGYIRVAIIAPGLGAAFWLDTEWPILIAVGIMILFQIINGEGLD